MSTPKLDTLDGYLLLAHGTSARELAARVDPASRFLTMERARMSGATSDAALAGSTSRPGEIMRREGIQARERRQMLGLDAWAPATAEGPAIPMTVTPRPPPLTASTPLSSSAAAAPVIGASRRFEASQAAALASSATWATVSAVSAGSEHCRHGHFTAEFTLGRGR